MADLKKTVAIEIAAQTTGAGDVQALAAELGRLQTASADAATSEAKARADALAARKAYDEQRNALDALKASTDAAGKKAAEYETQERTLTVAVAAARAALRDKQTAVVEAATAARTAAAAEQQLKGQIESTAAAAVLGAKQQIGGNAALAESLTTLRGQFDAVRNVALAIGGGSLVGSLAKELAQTADEYRNLEAKTRLAVGATGDAAATFAELFAVANRTGASVADVGTAFQRLSAGTKELGLSSTDALRVTETLSQALALGGATTQEATNATIQFSQALAAGVLRGQDLRSVLEEAPRLSKAFADGLGVSVGQLKQLGEQGALTSQQVSAALQGQSAALQSEFEKLPPTVQRATTQLSNSWTEYIGKASEASGTSATAASAIQALANNLSGVATVLIDAGKAAAAFAAIKLAAAFIEGATAARAAAVATAAATAATVTNTAATVANAEAQALSVGVLGRLVGTLKLVSFVGIVTNLRDIGTAIGEGIAKLAGYGKGLADLESRAKAEAEATRVQAQAKAAYAQALQQAADKAAGLDKASRLIIGAFDETIHKGEGTVAALEHVAKALQLDGGVQGVQAAVTALDVLQQRGKITATQLTDTLGAALKGLDLGKLQTEARAAFDTSEQGARRFKEVLDAIAGESLRRAGTSVRELATGFSAAAVSAINDVDALTGYVKTLGKTTDDTQRALVKALDQATTAAGTATAVQAVVDRVKELGREGLLTGDALAAALAKATAKADDLKAGTNSLDEALRTFGLKSATELTATANRLGEAYQTISASTTTSLAVQIEAFTKWRDAAVAAGKNVEDGQVRIAQVALEIKANAAGMGDALVAALDKGAQRADGLRTSLAGVAAAAAAVVTEMDTLAARNASVKSNNGATASSRSTSAAGQKYDANGFAIGVVGSGQLQPPDNGGGWTFDTSPAARAGSPGGMGRWVLTPEEQARRGAQESARTGIYRDPATGLQIPAPAPSAPAAPAATPSAAPQAPVTVNLNFGGQTYPVQTASKSAADTLVQALTEAAKRAGASV
jgi:tape measure domain-containing protein